MKANIFKSAILFSFVYIFAGCSGYQFITLDEGKKEYIETHLLTKDKAYNATLEWCAKTFNNANDVIQLRDKENGTIIMQAMSSYYFDILKSVLITYRYSLEIKLKDNKIKMVFTTGQTQNNGQLPQKGDLPKIFEKYDFLKNNLLSYLNNYKEDNF